MARLYVRRRVLIISSLVIILVIVLFQPRKTSHEYQKQPNNNHKETNTDLKHNLVMFTTWRHRAKKVHAREVVLRNWRHLSPKIQPLIFTKTGVLRDRCLAENWLVLPEDEIRCLNKIPTLRGMFNSAMSTINSHLYGFSNGDLVFAKDFVKSIEVILSDESLKNKPLLILAKRLNIEYRPYRNTAFTYDDIPRIAKQGEYPKEGSSDIFITNKLFPWKRALELVIGRMGVGMWLSAFARALNVTLIDVTNTSTVLHLTTDGNQESLKNIDMNCNHDIIKANNLTCDNFSVGFIDCADHATNYKQNGDIRIFKKQYFKSYCFKPAFYRFVDKIKARFSVELSNNYYEADFSTKGR